MKGDVLLVILAINIRQFEHTGYSSYKGYEFVSTKLANYFNTDFNNSII